MSRTWRWITLLSWAAAPACSGGATADEGAAGAAQGRALNFAVDVHPVFLAKCSGSSCHGDGRTSTPYQPGHGASDVEAAYAAALGTGVAGQPVYERILLRVASDDALAMMPPPYATPPCAGAVGEPGCLGEAELALIEQWVAQGTPP